MRTFHLGFTGDFLGPEGTPACVDPRAGLLGLPFIASRFLPEHAPRPGDESYWTRLYSMEVSAEALSGLDGLVVLRPYLRRRALLHAAERLVAVGRSGAGYDKIDVAACTEAGVALFTAPDATCHATASAALAFLLALAKRLPAQDRVVRAGRWDLQPRVLGEELPGRTLGIIGLGNSGRELARLVAPFGMRLIAYSPHAEEPEAAVLGVALMALDQVLRESDYVSLHCRLTAETRGLLGKEQLALMKPTAYLINVARGELVDQEALTRALQAGEIAGAALDVFTPEPLPAEHPLTSLDNVILSPHWAASTRDVWEGTARAMARGMLRVARGMVPENVVNPLVLQRPDFQAKLARFAGNGSGAG